MSVKPPKRPESVLVVVYTKCAQVLLMQRSDDPDFWQSVTGSLETDEQPFEAAKRELAEETGLNLEPVDCQRSALFEIRKRWQPRYPAGTTHNREHVFLAQLDAPCEITLAPDEHLAYQWLSIDDARSRLWSETNRQALDIEVKSALRQIES